MFTNSVAFFRASSRHSLLGFLFALCNNLLILVYPFCVRFSVANFHVNRITCVRVIFAFIEAKSNCLHIEIV